MGLHGSVDHGQAKPGALALGLGGEEGLYAFGEHLGGHALARVLDPEEDAALWTALGLDSEDATFRHGIAGVHRQVHQRMADRPSITPNHPEPVLQAHLEPDALEGGVAQKLAHLPNEVVEIDGLLLLETLVGEIEEALDHAPTPRAGVHDRVEGPGRGIGRSGLLPQCRSQAQDGAQHIVHVVGHPARQAAEALQLLGLVELGLKGPPFGLGHLLGGDVLLEGDVVGHLSCLALNGNDGGPFQEGFAPLLEVLEFAHPDLALREGLPHLPVDLPRGPGRLQDAGILPDGLAIGIAGHLGESGIHVLNGTLGIRDHNAERALFHRHRDLVQRFLGLPAARQILDDGQQARHVPLCIHEGHLVRADPEFLAGGVVDPFQDAQFRLAAGENLLVVHQVLGRVGGEQLFRRMAFDLLPLQAQVPADLVVHSQEPVVRVLVPDLGGHPVEDLLELVLLLKEGLLGLDAPSLSSQVIQGEGHIPGSLLQKGRLVGSEEIPLRGIDHQGPADFTLLADREGRGGSVPRPLRVLMPGLGFGLPDKIVQHTGAALPDGDAGGPPAHGRVVAPNLERVQVAHPVAIAAGHPDLMGAGIVPADPGHAELPELDHHLADLGHQGLPVRRPDDGLVHLAQGGVHLGQPFQLSPLGTHFRDVPGDGEHAGFALDLDDAGGHQPREQGPVLPPEGCLHPLHVAVSQQALLEAETILGLHPDPELSRQGGTPQDVFGRVARDPCEAFVDIQVDPIGEPVEVHAVRTGMEGLGELLLGGPQGLLRVLTVRDVPDDSRQRQGTALLIPLDLPCSMEPAMGAVGDPDDGVVQVEPFPARDDAGDVIPHLVPEGGLDQVGPPLQIPGIRLVDAEDPIEVRTALPAVPLDVPDIGPDPPRLLGGLQEPLACLQGGLGLPSLRLTRQVVQGEGDVHGGLLEERRFMDSEEVLLRGVDRQGAPDLTRLPDGKGGDGGESRGSKFIPPGRGFRPRHKIIDHTGAGFTDGGAHGAMTLGRVVASDDDTIQHAPRVAVPGGHVHAMGDRVVPADPGHGELPEGHHHFADLGEQRLAVR